MMCQTRLRGHRRVPEQFGAFYGAHGAGYIALAPTTWVPMGAEPGGGDPSVLDANYPPN